MRTLLFVGMLFVLAPASGQNLLENHLQNWAPGSSAVYGFNNNGSTSENARINGTGPLGGTVLLWRATPDSSSNPDGGWNTIYHDIDHTKTYRMVVWIKKTNSNSGSTYFGLRSPNNVYTLSGSINNNPYFFNGDLPQLNKWYLLVGFVHGSSHSGTSNTGGVYDPSTGSKVRSLTDFKFKSTAVNVQHRTYLYYDTNTSDRQYFYAPRIDEVTGTEPSVAHLLGRVSTSRIVFVFDNAGNQIARKIPSSTGSTSLKANVDEVAQLDEAASGAKEETPDRDGIIIHPNPTAGTLTMSWNETFQKEIVDIELYSMGNQRIPLPYTKGYREMQADLTMRPAGLYIVKFYLSDGSVILKKVIKK